MSLEPKNKRPLTALINGSINKLHLFLLRKSVQVDMNIFGLRNLNRMITKFAAHTNEETNPELEAVLKELQLFEFYSESQWSKLHRGILLKYKEFLVNLEKAIHP